ncbi:MAG TPA: MFS transporter, partial [Sphingomonas sp.]|nr:MFS transporter [Sphingomonas sp.]
DEKVASLAIAIFSVGVAIGSVAINAMLKGQISARYSPVSVVAMGAFVVAFSIEARMFRPAPAGQLYDVATFLTHSQSLIIMGTLLAIAVAGGMFVVPLYAFLTTTVTKDQTARTVAANNVVNAGAMTIGAVAVLIITGFGVTPQDMLLLVAAMCLVSAWLAQKLHRACD